MISLIPATLLASIFVRPILAQETTDSGLSYSTSSSGHVSPMFWVIEALIVIFFIAVFWKIFAKAGKPGWAAIIPIYNWVVWCQIVGRPAWWVLLLLICFPIFYIILCIDLAKSFGKGVGFALGMIFLSVIFFPILAFGSAQYQGPSAGAPAA